MKTLTDSKIKEINRAIKRASYSVEFKGESEYGYSSEWIFMTKNRYNQDLKSAENNGYNKRKEEEDKMSIGDLMEFLANGRKDF